LSLKPTKKKRDLTGRGDRIYQLLIQRPFEKRRTPTPFLAYRKAEKTERMEKKSSRILAGTVEWRIENEKPAV